MTAFFDKIDRLFTVKGLTCTFLAIIYLFIFFAGFPVVANAADDTTTTPSDDTPIVVSMGDSFSSGEGIEDFYDQDLSNAKKVESNDWLAHRSQKSWPGMLDIPGLDNKTAYYKDKNWFFVAASGAETKHINYEQDKEYSRGALNQYTDTAYLPPQIDVFKQFTKGEVDYVTITIGGNDAGFTKIIEEAVLGSTYLHTSDLKDKLSATWQKFYQKDGIRADIYDTYKKIEEAAGTNAQIIVAGYPKLLATDGSGWFASLDEATQINTAVSNFNIEIERIVNQCASEGMRISFVSVEDGFSGHEAYSDDPWINDVIFGTKDEDLKNIDKCSAYSMHPNYDGAIEYADCVNKKIEELAEKEAETVEQEALNPTKKEREIVLVLDASGSMSGTPMEETKKAAHKFVDTVLGSAEANIGIVSYDSVATVTSAITDSKTYLDNAIDNIGPGGSTNIEAGLKMAKEMLSVNDANKKIIVLMSDGLPNEGKEGQDLIDYAKSLREAGYLVYTLGFFSDVSNKAECQSLMNGIASDGCHFEVTDAESLVFFFGDIADQISGENFIFVRIACPVDVTVSYDGEELSSEDTDTYARTDFGSLTFEENNHSNSHGSDNRIKILRLKEGVDYDIKIEGNGKGEMDYSIGFVDADGEYSDVREFQDIEITKKTEIDTVATVSDATYMYVDQDGDGKYDITYRAYEDSLAEEVDYSYIIDICVAAIAIFALLIIVLVLKRYFSIRKYVAA